MNLPSNTTTITSREIAELTGKMHKDVMKAIRNMENAWHKFTGRKFALSEYKDATGRTLPMYQLTKTECLYIATKFNDEARAKLVLRWEQLETAERHQLDKLTSATTAMAESLTTLVTTMNNHSERLERLEKRERGSKPAKNSAFTPEVIDARDTEFDFARVNGRNVRRIIVKERVYYSVNDVLHAIGVSTGSGQVAKKLNRNSPHTVAKIHIFGNTHPAWFCTKKSIDLIKSGSRKLSGTSVKCELN